MEKWQTQEFLSGEWVRMVRERKEIPLRELARVARVDHGHLSRFERGLKHLSAAAEQRVVEALGE